jgi:hypothetical protein
MSELPEAGMSGPLAVHVKDSAGSWRDWDIRRGLRGIMATCSLS